MWNLSILCMVYHGMVSCGNFKESWSPNMFLPLNIYDAFLLCSADREKSTRRDLLSTCTYRSYRTKATEASRPRCNMGSCCPCLCTRSWAGVIIQQRRGAQIGCFLIIKRRKEKLYSSSKPDSRFYDKPIYHFKNLTSFHSICLNQSESIGQ